MNKLYFFAALALLSQTGFAAPSQNTVQTKIPGPTSAIAPSLGFTSFALKADGYQVGAQSGISLGANYYHNIGTEDLDLEIGLHYLQTGGKQAGYDQSLAFIDNSLNFSYVSLPIGARYKFFRFGAQTDNSVYAKGGVSPSYLVSAKFKSTSLGQTVEQDMKGEVNSFDLMGYLGIGGTYNMGDHQEILYELSYMRGTQKVLKNYASNINEGTVLSIMYSIGM
jgi:hypothetical protein